MGSRHNDYKGGPGDSEGALCSEEFHMAEVGVLTSRLFE